MATVHLSVDVKQQHHVISTLPVDPWYPYVENTGEMLTDFDDKSSGDLTPRSLKIHEPKLRIQIVNQKDACYIRFVRLFFNTIFPQRHTHKFPTLTYHAKSSHHFFWPTSHWWDLNSINPKAVKVGAIALLDPMVLCHGGRQWWHLIREDADDSHGHDELAIDCFYILHQIDAWWLFNMYKDDVFYILKKALSVKHQL